MTARNSGLVVPRRRALLGAAAIAAAPLAKPFISNAAAADTIKIGLLLAKTGDIAAQTEYLANGTYPRAGGTRQQDHGPAGRVGLARRTIAAGFAAEHAEAGAGK